MPDFMETLNFNPPGAASGLPNGKGMPQDTGSMQSSPVRLRELIVAMREVYAQGRNAMEYARRAAGTDVNSPEATLIAYDLQAGTYVDAVHRDPLANSRWCAQLAEILGPIITGQSSVLEIGCGEATTLAGLIKRLPDKPHASAGFDISWSRCAEGIAWLKAQQVAARLFVGDLFAIPMADESIDVVYTSHSLEPNGGREVEALQELLRITRKTLVIVEPIYELATREAQQRMRAHGYVTRLRETIAELGGRVADFRLLPYSNSNNLLNPSGVIVVEKAAAIACTRALPEPISWRCPLTATPLCDAGDVFYSAMTGIAYPVLRGIPLLRPEHAVIASKLQPNLLRDHEA